MDVAGFLALALQCAPLVAPDTLVTIARHESALMPWVLHDNSSNEALRFESREAAEASGADRVQRGHSVDFGLMQINSRNFGWLDVTPFSVLEPCRNVQAGAEVLTRAYRITSQSLGEGSAALRGALSMYVTGDPSAGLESGLVRQFEGMAPSYVVPPLTQTQVHPVLAVSRAVVARPRASTPAGEIHLDPFGAGRSADPFAAKRESTF